MNQHDDRQHQAQIKKNKKERVKLEAKETKEKVYTYPQLGRRMDYTI